MAIFFDRFHLRIAGVWVGFFALGLLIYGRALGGDFLLDDVNLILNNPVFHGPHPWRQIWFSRATPDFWPLSYTVLFAEWLVFGAQPLGYHLVNLAIHVTSAVLLWRVLVGLRLPAPLLIAALFFLHPVQVESVAWIFQTKTLLSGACVLASTLLFLRRENAWALIFSLVFFLLANLAKISAVTWPLVFLGYEWWRTGGRIKARAWLSLIPFFMVSLVLGLLNLSWYDLDPRVAVLPWFARLEASGQAVAFYFYKSVFPLHLNLIYASWSPARWGVFGWVPALVIVAAALVFCRPAFRGPVLWASAFFFVTLIPGLPFFKISLLRYALVADHYLYLSLLGVLVLVVWYCRRLGTAAVIVFCSLSFARASLYSTQADLLKDTIAKNPQAWSARNNLAMELAANGKIDEAIALNEQTLQMNPDFWEVHNNLGALYTSQGKLDQAVGEYQAALRLNPNYPKAMVNLGLIYESQGKSDLAIREYEAAVRMDPGFTAGHEILALAYSRAGRSGDAEVELERLEKQNPQLAADLRRRLKK